LGSGGAYGKSNPELAFREFKKNISRAEHPRLANIHTVYGNLACGENILALRLVSKLPDLRAGYADRILCTVGAQSTEG
jgi:hypothetical protein